jgi:predicted anti-sigma-YlaC factor YlaD
MKYREMKCEAIRELMPDLAAGLSAATPETEQHLRACGACADQLKEMRQTMELLDEWQAPEPSPYFDVRLQARLREEAAKPARGWMQWFRKPALAASLTVLIVVSATLVRDERGRPDASQSASMTITAQPGTAVGDLQALDKNHELYSDFDVLDDLQVQQNVAANP